MKTSGPFHIFLGPLVGPLRTTAPDQGTMRCCDQVSYSQHFLPRQFPENYPVSIFRCLVDPGPFLVVKKKSCSWLVFEPGSLSCQINAVCITFLHFPLYDVINTTSFFCLFAVFRQFKIQCFAVAS